MLRNLPRSPSWEMEETGFEQSPVSLLKKHSAAPLSAFSNKVFQKQVTEGPEGPVLSSSLPSQSGQCQTAQVQILTQPFTTLMPLDMAHESP